MARRNFFYGPWGGRRDDDYSAVPPYRIPVYADPQPAGVVCADEQVVHQLGHYRRLTGDCDCGWNYWWAPR